LHNATPGIQSHLLESLVYSDGLLLNAKSSTTTAMKAQHGKVVLGILAVKSSHCPAILRDPSCAVCCIGAHIPLPGNEYDFVFKGFCLADDTP